MIKKERGNNLKRFLKAQRLEYQKYLGVLAEDFGSKLRLVAESLAGIQQQLTSVRDMVAQNTEDIEKIKLELLQRGEPQLVRRSEFTSLQHRLVKLERLIQRK